MPPYSGPSRHCRVKNHKLRSRASSKKRVLAIYHRDARDYISAITLLIPLLEHDQADEPLEAGYFPIY